MMTIGRFARLSGVSVHALRHYDEVGILVPAEVDPASGYRRYQRAQIHDARLIQALRGIDLPVEEVRRILDAATDEEIHHVLAHHRQRLDRQRSHLAGRINQIDRYLEKGITMPTVQSGCRPVQIQLAVDDAEASTAFYREAFSFRYDVARRTKKRDRSAFIFGEYGQDDFFLLWLLGPDRCDRPGPANVGLLVSDLDTFHARAVAAGATEIMPPRDAEGMPRSSIVKDPSGNWIGLAQGWSDIRPGCRPVQIKIAVDDVDSSAAFYQDAFGFRYDVARHTVEQNYEAFIFGEYGQDDFFLLWLLDDPDRFDHPGSPASFSLLVEDLDAIHARAIAAGATEIVAPYNSEGKPRSSAVTDPSGNRIGLAQG